MLWGIENVAFRFYHTTMRWCLHHCHGCLVGAYVVLILQFGKG
jgi:hypothetical protein